MMNTVCVFLGTELGHDPAFKEAASLMGAEIAKRNLTLLYGGSSRGLMGCLALGALNQGGRVVGIMPEGLISVEKPLEALHELVVTETIQQRKSLMLKQADSFVVLPGGIGTLDETFATWTTLNINEHQKPLGFLNVNHYFKPLFALIDHCKQSGFIKSEHLKSPTIASDPILLLDGLMGVHKKVEKTS